MLCMYVCVYIYTYIHTYTHMYMYTTVYTYIYTSTYITQRCNYVYYIYIKHIYIIIYILSIYRTKLPLKAANWCEIILRKIMSSLTEGHHRHLAVRGPFGAHEGAAFQWNERFFVPFWWIILAGNWCLFLIIHQKGTTYFTKQDAY